MDTDFSSEGKEVNEGEDRKKQLKGRAGLANHDLRFTIYEF